MGGVLQLIDTRRPVHMVGVGGIGMAGVALLLQQRGCAVSGCDAAADCTMIDTLRAAGIVVQAGHSALHVETGCDWVIRTAAVRDDIVEVAAAHARGLPVFRRGEVLPALLEGYGSVAVAGTHGKTTTSTLIVQLLRASGRDPSWCVGGVCAALGTVARAGTDRILVVEADESDGTLALYRPGMAVVTNVDFDHMEHFPSVEAFEDSFRTFIGAVRHRVFYCGDDPRARRLGGQAPNGVSYGFDENVQLRGVPDEEGGPILHVMREGTDLGVLPLSLPGMHNALNLLAAVGVCLELGVPFEVLQAAAGTLVLPRRRYETVAVRDSIQVISDYAHHPTEIAALIRTARRTHRGRMLAVFQPHRYTRTAALGADFPAAFVGVDLLVLTPVYAASEPPREGGRTCDLYARFRARADGVTPLLATSNDQARAFFRRTLRPGDLLLVIGAGDVDAIAYGMAADMAADEIPSGVPPGIPGLSGASTVHTDAELGAKTTYRTGGTADCRVDAANEADIAAVLRYSRERALPVHVLGAGSNILVSDLGVRGVVLRLAGAEFRHIRREGETVVAGGAVRLARLQEWLTAAGLTGLEFLEGVPGGVGGAVRMNAGAYGHEVRERILWIRGLNREGERCMFPADSLEWSYRGCEALRDIVVTEAGFRLEQGTMAVIRARRGVIAERRDWMRGMRCSGSVFRNPPGGYSGQLVEAAGLKGLCIGGARVHPRHANFIVAAAGATASDVLALMQCVAAAVERASGVKLVRETVCLE